MRAEPGVELGEFVNVGVVVSCQSTGLLEAGIELDPARVRALDPHVDLDALRAHLDAIATICRGGPGSGPIGALPPPVRFPRLPARRRTIIPVSTVPTWPTHR